MGADNTLQQSVVTCPTGKTAIGGGFSPAGGSEADYANLNVVSSQPSPAGWLVEGFNTGAVDVVVTAYVVCANVG
jgi:hypothetical protein